MSSKGSKTTTATQKAGTVTEKVVEKKATPAPVVAEAKPAKGGKKEVAPTPAPAPVVAEAKPAKGGKKEAVQAAPVAAPAPVAEAKPAKGGKKEAAPVVAAPVAQAGGAKVDKAEKKEKKVKKEAEAEPVQAAPVAQAGGDDVEEEEAGSKLRYFKLFYNDTIQGRYSGKKPKQAANKAFSSIIKTLKESGQQNGGVNVDIDFTIRECTRNSKHKDYKYVGKRQELDKPVMVDIANADGSKKQITYKFCNKLQKAPREQVQVQAQAPAQA